MGKRREPDPFRQAARIWATDQAERRKQRAALEREVILVVGRHPVRGEAEHSPVRPVAPDPVLELYRRGYLVPIPEYSLGGIIGLHDEPEALLPALPRPSSPGLPSAQDRERTLAALVRRAERAREEDRRRVTLPRAGPVRDAAREQERQRRLREAYEARRPTEPARIRPGVGVPYPGLPAARQVSRSSAPPRPRASLPVRDLGRSGVERDVETIVARRGPEPPEEQARRPGLPGFAKPTLESLPEAQRDVLRDLNRKYDTHLREPWQMLARLRRGADQLRSSGGDPRRIQELASDHRRLHRAVSES